ncbi:RNA methyltransferase-domain-containing protein [Pelagophyceae sp. CCMP2097]|nr:RNA methyltransferase-domain-containing protein [Pelagophyceae sp. CCMP2097]
MLLLGMLSLVLRLPRRCISGRRATIRCINRVLLETHELAENGPTVLAAADRRAAHVRDLIWRSGAAETLRVGVADGGAADVRAALRDDGALVLETAGAGLESPAQRPPLDVVLAIPAPLRLKRMLPVLASLDVDNLYLVGTQKVEKAYFRSHLLQGIEKSAVPLAVPPGPLRDLLLEGCEQSGVTAVPRLALCASLPAVLRHLAPNASETLRVCAHPDRGDDYRVVDDATGLLVDMPRPRRLRAIARDRETPPTRAILAVGPERGWEEPDELALLREHGFDLLTLGPRTLRTDVALISLLGLLNDLVAPDCVDRGPRRG